MKITLHPNAAKLPVDDGTAQGVYVSFEDIVRAVQRSYILLEDKEYVSEMTIEQYGVVFQVKKLGE